jgi:hypothetical protein
LIDYGVIPELVSGIIEPFMRGMMPKNVLCMGLFFRNLLELVGNLGGRLL